MPKVNLERRGVIRAGAVGAIAIAASLAGRALPKAVATTSPSTKSSTKSSTKASSSQIIKLANLPIGATHNFTSVKQGVPAILFRTKVGVFAYSAICTHQGCTVSYDKSSEHLVCPCHGATYDPAKGAKVLSGPTKAPLAKVKVAINGAWIVEA